MTEPILSVSNLKKHFPIRKGLFSRVAAQVKAVDGVSFSIAEGETLGLVGESGCGKTTVGRLVTRLLKPDAGQIIFQGQDLSDLSEKKIRPLRQDIQMIFQDPYSSLNPRMPVGETIVEPLIIHGQIRRGEKRAQAGELLEKVGLKADYYDRYPHEFSGGQRQRIGIARAIALKPKLIIADEAVSALDVSVAAQVVMLLEELQKDLGIAYLFIAHDLPLVQRLSQNVAVMYLGKIVELCPSKLLTQALHPYTLALIDAVPVPDPEQKRERIVLSGEVPSPVNPPSGCYFHPRCRFAEDRCRSEEPALLEWQPGRWAACHFADKVRESE